jgi:hypothetical protein
MLYAPSIKKINFKTYGGSKSINPRKWMISIIKLSMYF